jgi:hypothetical protein
MLGHFEGGLCVRDVKVEAGGRELNFTMVEAKEWVAAGLARWVGRNRLLLTARCDSKPTLHGISSVVGQTLTEVANQPWAQTFIRLQFLKREPDSAG